MIINLHSKQWLHNIVIWTFMFYAIFIFKHNKPAHCRFVSWQLSPGSGIESSQSDWNVAFSPISCHICVQHESYRWHLFWRCSTLKREVSSPQWPFFRSVRTKERQTETERCGSLVTSLFCVLCLDANAVWEDSCPSVCCAHARIFSSLLPPFFLFFLSFSFYFKCVLAACFLIVSQVFIVLVCAAQLKKNLTLAMYCNKRPVWTIKTANRERWICCVWHNKPCPRFSHEALIRANRINSPHGGVCWDDRKWMFVWTMCPHPIVSLILVTTVIKD